MTTISKDTFRFLKDLKKNNDRAWFLDNKSRYETARADFEAFLDELLTGIAKFDAGIAHHRAKDCIFRIYRDVRFSKDKSPYKTHLGAYISPAMKKSDIHSRAGYYIHIEPGASILAGGAYMPQGEWLKAIRQEIDYNAGTFKKIVNNHEFKAIFGELEGDKLKRAPKGYTPDHPEIELLRYKSFLAVHKCDDKTVISKDFMQQCISVFKTLFPLNEFLNRSTD